MLHISDLTYRLGPRLLLDQASCALPPRAKVGLLGRNGTGKTTLFRIVLGEIAPESGSVTLPRGMRIGTVAQEAPGGPESLIDVVLAADTERAALLAEAETTTDPMRRADIETRLVDIDAWSAESRAATILHGLGFSSEAQRRPCASFSGGWRMRVALAAILFTEPDLLLLDEPTNYLDLEGTLWLYDYLARYPHTALIISHDRELLEDSVDHILHLDQSKLTLYRGGYSSFLRQYNEKRVQLQKRGARQEAERKHLQSFVDRFRAKATKAKQAQSRLKRLEKMEAIAAVVERDVLPFVMPSPERALSPPLIGLEQAAVGYGTEAILSRLDISLLPDDRVALLGPNGNGKSTFCKMLAGRLPLQSGQMRRSSKLRVAYFAQHQVDELRLGETAYQHVAALLPGITEAQARSRAARMGFSGGMADTPVSQLSGGEKARLMLGLVTLDAPHLLILDEPTNHLDIDSRTALTEAINGYAGAVILVSHDRFLLEACADRLWLVADGTVRTYDGDLDDYRATIVSTPSRPRAAPPAPAAIATAAPAQAPKRPSRNQLERKISALAADLAKLESLLARVDQALADPDLFRADAAKAGRLAQDRRTLAARIAALEDEWLTLSTEIEASE